MTRTPQTKTTPPDLWDPVVRISHWGLAVIVLANAVFTRGGSAWHVWLGWIGMALLLLRMVWGLLGPKEARFSAFPPNPRAALSHLHGLVSGQPGHYPSHNPAGALMIYAFWGALAIVISTGLVMTGGRTPMRVAEEQAAVATGDWSVLVAEDSGENREDGSDEGTGDLIQEVHELAANLILIFAVLHVAGVLVESWAMRRNLLAPMLAGRRGTRPPR